MTSIADDWESVFDVIRQPIWAVDSDHAVRYANPAAAEAMGYDRPSDLLGRDGRPVTAVGAPEREAADLTGPVRGEGTLTCVDGSLLLVEWTLVPLPRPGGGTALYIFRPLAEPIPDSRGPRDAGPPSRLLAHRQAERERQHARTLQHQVQEHMVRALLGLNLVRQELATAPARVIDLLHSAACDTEEALAGVRDVTDALCPGALRAGGLPAAFAALALRCPVRMTVSGTLTERLPPLVETHVYLLVAEAVERAVEHGRADRVQVTADLGTSLVVTVVDDGAPPAGAVDLAALTALTERAATLDGTLTVSHTPGTGTTVTVAVPLRPGVAAIL
ncbi:PAS domain-containing protein [Streptomyces sp. NBC_00019]|uniref:PAS domain-containing protein n=1 Tax=Streptomyces sp. NBC_00019 TaxID=2975623 RepID=UPI002F914191